MYKWITIALAVVLAALIGGGAVYWLTRPGGGGATTAVVSVDAIKQVAQLATVEYYVSQQLYKQKDKSWYEWLQASFIAYVKGIVKGSVDLKETDVTIDHDNRKVRIKFHKGAVLVSNPEIGPNDIGMITCSDPNILHPINDDDRNKAQNELIATLRNTALRDGIETKTADEAKLVLSNFLQALGYASEISFEDEPFPKRT